MLFDRIRPIEPFLRRIFSDAVRPVGGGAPVPLLVFKDRESFEAFFRTLGAAWDVKISAPKAGGYALQDFAASFHDPAQGLRRPVFVHEIVHAVAARNLRILPGNPAHTWMHEALANYVQLVLFPDSLPRGEYVKQFGTAIDPGGATFFKPLDTLLDSRISMANYAQLASLMAFMIEKKPGLLPPLAKGLAAGESAAAIIGKSGVTLA